MKAVLVLLASLTFAIPPFLSSDFGGFDPNRYPIPQENSPVQPAGIMQARSGSLRGRLHCTQAGYPLHLSSLSGYCWQAMECCPRPQLLEHRKLCLTFADTKKMQFASVSGRGRITEDRELIEKLWGPYCEAFFPDGRDSVAVITIEASQAEYWDNDKGNLSIAYEVAKAYFGDEGPDLGENAKLDL